MQLLNNQITQDIFKIHKLINYIIIKEAHFKSKCTLQYTNCQRYGHINKSYRLQSPYVKCNSLHHYSKYDKISETPA